MTGGDFVRNVKQTIDLLRQVADVAPDPATAAAARGRRRRLPPRRDRGLERRRGSRLTMIVEGRALGPAGLRRPRPRGVAATIERSRRASRAHRAR